MTYSIRRSVKGSFVLAAVAALLAGTMASPSGASTSTVIDVFPGANAIQNAVQAAHTGDVLSVHTGTYPENVLVTKDGITIEAAGDGPVTVDGGCAESAFTIRGDSVVLSGLQIIGGDFYNVDYRFTQGGSVTGNRIKSTCPDAEYGVNVFDTGPLVVENNTIQGFRDAGIYIGGIIDTGSGSLIARRNDVFRNNQGILVEDSFGVSLFVRNNTAHDNFDDGIWIHNSDGIRVTRNTVENNAFAGIELDDLSDNNLVGSNRARGNVFDLVNGSGSGNCFQNNTYTTSSGVISC
jgi:parallel beta-helix repeat protein